MISATRCLANLASDDKKHIVSIRHVTQRGRQLSLAHATKTEFWRFVVGLALPYAGFLGLRSRVVQQMGPIQNNRHQANHDEPLCLQHDTIVQALAKELEHDGVPPTQKCLAVSCGEPLSTDLSHL